MFKPGILGAFLSLLLCSCATQNSIQSSLPPTVALNHDGGRGDWVIVTLRLESGEELPFVVDTGCPITLLDKSFRPKLGKNVGRMTFWNFGAKQESDLYAAPALYLGNTRLLTGPHVATFDFHQLAKIPNHPILGILGMDVLEHYRFQLDFKNDRLRFLSHLSAPKKSWGKPFPLIDAGDGRFVISDSLVGTSHSASLIDTGCEGDGWLTANLFQQWTNQVSWPTNGEVRSPQGLRAAKSITILI